MNDEKQIRMIENGKQIGVKKLIEINDTTIYYVYAIQKINGKYLVYLDETDLNQMYYHELWGDTAKIFIYDTLTEFFGFPCFQRK